MTRSRLALVGASLVAAATLALVPTAASAHTDNLFVWVTDDLDFAGFGTISKTDAGVAALGADESEIGWATGLEVCDEVAYAVADQEFEPSLVTWNHDTGEVIGEPVELFHEIAELDFVGELDALADCTLLGIAFFDGGDAAVVSIDVETGELTIEADLTDAPLRPAGIATDAAGTTYVFVSDYGSDAEVTTVDLATGTVGGYDELVGMNDLYGGGPTFGVDFDAADTMYMIIGADNQERYRLTSFPAGSDLLTATPVDIGDLEFTEEGDLTSAEPFPLAAEGHAAPAPAPEPQLAATGTALPLGVALAAGILVLGGAVLVMSRRRTA